MSNTGQSSRRSDNHVEQLTGGRIDPLQILKHNQHGPLAGQGLDLA